MLILWIVLAGMFVSAPVVGIEGLIGAVLFLVLCAVWDRDPLATHYTTILVDAERRGRIRSLDKRYAGRYRPASSV